ncbi:MAG TPA: hypothetical protein VHU80_16105 [Polyangiaceae bacterium]|nr:hypothetical protein [Polyangiaceae bacterium]
MEAEGIRLVGPENLNGEQREFLEQHLKSILLPGLTPIAIDPGHPFPHLGNRSLCLVAAIRATTLSALPNARMVVVHMPSGVLSRFIRLPSPPFEHHFMLLEELVRHHLPWLYRGYEVLSCHAIRVTRDAEFDTDEHGTHDRLAAIEAGLRERRMGSAVRLQYDAKLPADDNVKVHEILSTGRSRHPDGVAGAPIRAQERLYAMVAALEEGPPVPVTADVPAVTPVAPRVTANSAGALS